MTTVRPFAVITGASRGIGAEYARALAERGYDLLLVGRDRAKLEGVAAELRDRHGASAETLALDLSEANAAHRLFAAARERRPAVDLLINNAGFGLFGDFVSHPMPKIQAMLRLHIDAAVESCRLFLPGMIERRSGAIINVASTAGFMSIAYLAEYAATKAFLIAFSEAVAEEVRESDVCIQVCCPGTTATDFHATAGRQPKNPFRTQTAREVVEASLGQLGNGRTTVTTHWSGSLTDFLGRWVPRRLLTRHTAKWMKSALR